MAVKKFPQQQGSSFARHQDQYRMNEYWARRSHVNRLKPFFQVALAYESSEQWVHSILNTGRAVAEPVGSVLHTDWLRSDDDTQAIIHPILVKDN